MHSQKHFTGTHADLRINMFGDQDEGEKIKKYLHEPMLMILRNVIMSKGGD